MYESMITITIKPPWFSCLKIIFQQHTESLHTDWLTDNKALILISKDTNILSDFPQPWEEHGNPLWNNKIFHHIVRITISMPTRILISFLSSQRVIFPYLPFNRPSILPPTNSAEASSGRENCVSKMNLIRWWFCLFGFKWR